MLRLIHHNETGPGDAGWTISELMVVLAILPFIIGTAYLLLNSTSGMSDRIQTRSYLSEQTRGAVDLMTRELRQAGEIQTGGGVFATTQPRTCSFYVDLNHDNAPERVTYTMSGTSLVRTQASATTSVPPFSYGANGAAKSLVATMSPSFTGPIFTYYDQDGVVLGTTQGDECSSVGLHVVDIATTRSKDATVSVELSTWVKIRSVFNNIN